MYQWKQLVICLIFILFAACLGHVAIHFICKISLSGRIEKIRDAFLAILIASTLIFFSNVVFFALTEEQGLVFSLIITGTLLLVMMYKKVKPVNVLLTVLSLLSIITGLAREVSDSLEAPVELKEYNYTLQNTPNIYLYILESYHDLSTMRQVYDIDTSDLEKFLEENSFVIYEDALSNSHNTLLSLGDIFSMQLDSGRPKGLDDSTLTTRLIIAGHNGNVLLKNLKGNGYHTEYILRREIYYLTSGIKKGPYLDELDIASFIYLTYPLADLNDKLKQKIQIMQHHHFRRYLPDTLTVSLKQAVIKFVDEKFSVKSPYFVFFKGGALHAPGRQDFLPRYSEEWIASGIYKNRVKKSNEELIYIVEDIIKRDPESVIILLGDHGSRRLDGLWVKEQTLETLEAKVRANGETLDSLTKDLFGILMAVRMPDGRQDISNGYHLSPANLFRHIFAALNEDPDILKGRVPSESKYLNGVAIARDGKTIRR